jgi:mycothiol synthase
MVYDSIAYCKKHLSEVDNSYLDEEDLSEFVSNEQNPTYVAISDDGAIFGVASLIINEYALRSKSLRFRIFHVETPEVYPRLFAAILKSVSDFTRVYLFVPINNMPMRQSIEALHFTVERYAFYLVRDEQTYPEYCFPKGYTLSVFRPGTDEEDWCRVRNAAFAHLKGSETPITPEMVSDYPKHSDYIADGMLILRHNSQAVGIIGGSYDDYEGVPVMHIGPLAIHPDYQRKGLGRMMLRAALDTARKHSLNITSLSVNGDNENAKKLYLQEGFREAEAVVCYEYRLR